MKQIHKVLFYNHPWQVTMDADIQGLDGWELVSCHEHIKCTAIYRKSVTDKEYKKWRKKVEDSDRVHNRVWYEKYEN